MKEHQFTIGVDVSKLTLDIHCAQLAQHIRIENGSKGFMVFKKWCKEHDINLRSSLIIMEYTGGYEYRLIQFCESAEITYCRVPGLAIKKSMGITRGKNDKVDSKRIAQYGEEKRKTLEPSKPLSKPILALRELLSLRKKLVRENAGYIATIKERIFMYESTSKDTIIKMLKKKEKSNLLLIKKVEEEIKGIVIKDPSLLKNFEILTSIKGIGKVNAWMTIAYTENFTSFKDARSYAVYVGVVPFDNSSGNFKGRKRVCSLANKELKQEINQAAKTAIVWNEHIKRYADRKLLNKPYPLVLNNVKFKMILLMFALIKRGEKYVENYGVAA